MANKLGFTFYPQDWWSSDTFFDFDAFERYVYLECIFQMYRNDGYMKTQKTQFENRARISVSDETWLKVTSKFLLHDKGYTSLTVNKRLKIAVNSRENGKLGGRPPKNKNPENPASKPKEKEKEKENVFTDKTQTGISIAIKPVYANERPMRVFDLGQYFEEKGQIESLRVKGWMHFTAFMESNPGRVFNDPDHLYNTFRAFCKDYRPPPKDERFSEAEFNKGQWTLEAWEKAYKWKLNNDPEFAKHFGYAKLQDGSPVGINHNGRGGPTRAPKSES